MTRSLKKQVKVVKCGNSLMVSIPHEIVSYLGVQIGDLVDVHLKKDTYLVYSFKVKRQLSLTDFLKTKKTK
ncbi:MAG: AbrB/MazE/SpoVT family DNA-binding domain-containing protein [bacterium]|nr:AbrB/MazE/SpoVT family DNA-binding domain-containing protein [bacterium]